MEVLRVNRKVKSSVQKPVAIKYKSKQTADKKPPPMVRKSSLPAQKLVHTPPSTASKSENSRTSTPRVRSAKKLLTCYICGREFGTASLPLHEPKCLEKWERENSKLPPNLQRNPPQKPDGDLTQEDWNKLAWESSQAMLTPCVNCGRTFFPDRLLVHQRSCKTPQANRKMPEMIQNSVISTPTPATPSASPPSTECYVCGRMFGTHSIKIHEKNCLKKWNMENDALPADMRSPVPIKGMEKMSVSPEIKEEPRTQSAKKPPLFPCYLCGKLFTVNSIYIHEPQCLKMWKIENDKLPPNKRRPQPLKPDIKFTPTGDVDFVGTFNRIWDNHLTELRPCHHCGRTFFPNRIEVHRRACAEKKV